MESRIIDNTQHCVPGKQSAIQIFHFKVLFDQEQEPFIL